MADDIRVVDSELQQCAAEYKASLQTLGEAVREYQQAIEALSHDWTGRAAVIMCGHVISLAGKIFESFDRVNDAIDELGGVEELFEANEAKQKNVYANQDVGTKSPFGN